MALSRLRRFSVTYLPRQIYNLAFIPKKIKNKIVNLAMCKLEIAVHFTAILAI
jgi:hypothetical protein